MDMTVFEDDLRDLEALDYSVEPFTDHLHRHPSTPDPAPSGGEGWGHDAGVVFYGESQLTPLAGTCHAGTPHTVGELIAARSPVERERLVRRMLRELGFDWLGYGTVMQQRRTSRITHFFTTYANAAWTERYFAERYHEVDSRLIDAPRSGLPLTWDLDDLASRGPSRHGGGTSRRFLKDLGDNGLRSGLFFQLPSPTWPHQHTVISLSSSRPDRGWIADGVLGRALTLGMCLHEFLSTHVERRPAAVAPGGQKEISALQQRILQCLSRGQSDKEIAHGLQLSSHTVDYHMRQLRRRFGVRNRVQLVSMAT